MFVWQQGKASATMVCHPFHDSIPSYPPIGSGDVPVGCGSFPLSRHVESSDTTQTFGHPSDPRIWYNLRMSWRTSEPPEGPELRTTLPTRLSTCSRPAISDPPFTSNLIQSQKATMMDYLHPISAQPHRLSISYSQNSLWQTRRGGSLDVWKVPRTLQ